MPKRGPKCNVLFVLTESWLKHVANKFKAVKGMLKEGGRNDLPELVVDFLLIFFACSSGRSSLMSMASTQLAPTMVTLTFS